MPLPNLRSRQKVLLSEFRNEIDGYDDNDDRSKYIPEQVALKIRVWKIAQQLPYTMKTK